MIQECENKTDNYKQIVKDMNDKNVLDTCCIDSKWYPMFQNEECALKNEYKHLAERF